MSRRLLLRAAARAEFKEAAAWYEQQRAGLGAEFVSEVDRVLEAIVDQPDYYPLASGDVRVGLVRKFPYAVYFRIKPTLIAVIAVFHTSRNSAVWQLRR